MKNLFDLKIDEKGFVLIEFVIALPLIIFLLYGFTQTLLKGVEMSKIHAADYELEVEAQEVLARIVEDARAASYVKREVAIGGMPIDKITINYHANKYDDGKIIDVIDTRIYTVAMTEGHGAYVYAQRQGGYHSSPITGGNFFGENVVTYLKYFKLGENILYIILEMESLTTNQRIRLSTAVYMPACEKMQGFKNYE